VLQDDWRTPHQHKLEITAAAHPNPTRWELTGTEVFPEAPLPEDTVVESGVDPAAFAATAAAAPRAARRLAGEDAGGDAGAVQQPQKPAGEVVFSNELMTVYKVNGWVEGTVPCVQYDVKVRVCECACAFDRSKHSWHCLGLRVADYKRLLPP